MGPPETLLVPLGPTWTRRLRVAWLLSGPGATCPRVPFGYAFTDYRPDLGRGLEPGCASRREAAVIRSGPERATAPVPCEDGGCRLLRPDGISRSLRWCCAGPGRRPEPRNPRCG